MGNRVLITGGAGFIGSHMTRRLLSAGHEVSVLDNFNPQIHGEVTELPPDLRQAVRLFRGDIRDESLMAKALQMQQVVIHLAAETGTGQSMYCVRHYTDVNIGATSTLMELLLSGKYQVQTVITASSRAVYGEGAARCSKHGLVYPKPRSVERMREGDFEPKCPSCSQSVEMAPTSEEAPLRPNSLYGITKQVQEQLTLLYAAALGLNGFALRYQNVYGPGQSLKNPYTGILAIFSERARANDPIYIFEDGKESRDFVYIDDVVEATARCVEAGAQAPVALNVGSGLPIAVAAVVKKIVEYFGSSSKVSVNGAFRVGDIRHNCADVARLGRILNFVPAWRFEDGLLEFLRWTESQEIQQISYEQSLAEMRLRGLLHG